jgi:hypothetical protein
MLISLPFYEKFILDNFQMSCDYRYGRNLLKKCIQLMNNTLRILFIFFILMIKSEGVYAADHSVLDAVKEACKAIYNDATTSFETLNKPTNSEMSYALNDEAGFRTRVLTPSALACSWKGSDGAKYQLITSQFQSKFAYEQSQLLKILSANGIVAGDPSCLHLRKLLFCRIYSAVVESFKSGNCGEFVYHATFSLLLKKHLSQISFDKLEIVELSSRCDHLTHVIGIINRKEDSALKKPSTWGDDAIVYDPWNKGAYFLAGDMMQRNFYKYGKWDSEWRTDMDINFKGIFLQDECKFFERYIMRAYLPFGVEYEFMGNFSVMRSIFQDS